MDSHNPLSVAPADPYLIRPLSVKEIVSFAAEKNTPLNHEQVDQITRTCESKELKPIILLLNSFSAIQKNFNLIPGLNQQQHQLLNQLIDTHKTIKTQLEHQEIDTFEALKRILPNEKRLIPLDLTIKWWRTSKDSLNNNKVWVKMKKIVIQNAASKRLSRENIQKKSQKLDDLHKMWLSHEYFCGYASDDLLVFFRRYVLEAEKNINLYLRLNTTILEIVKRFIEAQLFLLHEVKKSAVYSMLHRLKTASYFSDLQNDDLIVYLADILKKNYDLSLIGEDAKLLKRHSLSPDLIVEFISVIGKYCRENADDQELALEFKNLPFTSAPEDWAISPKDRNVVSLTNHPVVLFCVNTFSDSLNSLPTDLVLAKHILSDGKLDDSEFILNRMKFSLDAAIAAAEKIAGVSLDKITHPSAQLLREFNEKFVQKMNALSGSMAHSLANTLETTIDDALSGKSGSKANVENYLQKSMIVVKFNQIFGDKNLLLKLDFILTLAKRLKTIYQSNRTIDVKKSERIDPLIQAFYPNMQQLQLEQMQAAVKHFPAACKDFDAPNEAALMHFIVNYFESPLLDDASLPLALARHQEIAKLYGEEWEDEPEERKIHESLQKINQLDKYISNVALRLIKPSNVSPDNFETHSATKMLTRLQDEMLSIESSDHSHRLQKTSSHMKLNALKSRINREMADKLSDQFMLKNYLSNESKIDVGKLESLVDKTRTAFVDPGHQQVILGSLTTACQALVKKHCEESIKKGLAPDVHYIKKINALLGANLFIALGNDADIKACIDTYVETIYDGNTTILSNLFAQIAAADNPKNWQDVISKYARRRLDVINSTTTIIEDDYIFFHPYRTLSNVNSYLRESRTHFQKFISAHSDDTKTQWQHHIACVIELLGYENEVHNYRLKRVFEFLTLAKTHAVTTEESKRIFLEFLNSINKNYSFNKRILREDSASGNKSLTGELETLIHTATWSLLLEETVNALGTRRQQQELHFNLAKQLLETDSDLSEGWIIVAPAERQSQKLSRDFFIKLYGADNIQKLVGLIEKSTVTIKVISQALHQREYSKISKADAEKLIAKIKLFTEFYQLFGKQLEAKQALESLHDLEEHLSLYAILAPTLSVSNTVNSNTQLQHICTAMTSAVRQIEDSNALTHETLNAYLQFINNEFFLKLDALLSHDNLELDYDVLNVIINLLNQLCSQRLKKLLCIANELQVSTNYYWMTLINRLDEKNYINRISKILASKQNKETEEDTVGQLNNQTSSPMVSKPTKENSIEMSSPAINKGFFEHAIPYTRSKEYMTALTFAEALINIKRKTMQLIKRHFLTEAGIPVPPAKDVHLIKFIQSEDITSEQLHILGGKLNEKLDKEFATAEMGSPYLAFLIKTIDHVNKEINKRARDNYEYWHDHLSRTQRSTTLKITQLLERALKPQSSPFVTFNDVLPKIENEEVFRPFLTWINKTSLVDSLDLIEKYIGARVPNPKEALKLFKEKCEDPTFITKRDPKILNLFRKQSYLFHTHHNLLDSEILYLMQIYKLCKDILEEKKMKMSFHDCISVDIVIPMKELTKLLGDIKKQSLDDPLLLKLDNYKKLLEALISLATNQKVSEPKVTSPLQRVTKKLTTALKKEKKTKKSKKSTEEVKSTSPSPASSPSSNTSPLSPKKL